ncbi:hypothetical protein [Leifsonia virtsii]|uniref:Uncharacterized protein n=1 Tax=Leifsonia virtsii TaxID=3035915 RepID=A0ABT8IWL8_9MICO|nr:hypothetical protein [Leifsonia virtsii]MDN4597195.1 hypothetical protein [Leifsonia virtsii]
MEQQVQVDVIAEVIGEPAEGHPSDSAGAADRELRRLYAQSWVNAGFTDPREVAAWIAEGVHHAGIAAEAYRAGFRPGDPWVERSDACLVPPRQEPLTAPGWFAVRANRARARRAWRARELKRRRADALFDEQMRQLAWLTRSLDFDAGFGAISLELIGRSDVPVIEADVLRGYDEYADALVLLRERLAADPSDAPAIQGELSRWYGIGQVIGLHLHVCDGPIRRTIEAQLAADQRWLDGMRQHHRHPGGS